MTGNPPGGERSFADLLSDLWHGRFHVFLGLSAGVLSAFLLLALAVPHGGAHMAIAPALPIDLAVSARLPANGANGMAGTESLAERNFERFQTVAGGAAASSLLLRNESLARGLSQDRAFRFSGTEKTWTPAKLAEYINRRVIFEPVGETALRRVRYMHPDPEFAAFFLQRLHAVSDGLIRHNARREVNGRIDYLRGELEKTRNPDHRRALADLLMEQERLRMLVSIDQPYAAAVVEPAFAAPSLRWPDALFVFAAFAGAGALAGFAVFSLRPSSPAARAAPPRPAQKPRPETGLWRGGMTAEQDNGDAARHSANRKPGSFPDAAE